jgi:formyltetrahydrofolate synthetase
MVSKSPLKTDLDIAQIIKMKHIQQITANINLTADDPKLLVRPSGFDVTVREFEIAGGAGFLIPILGKMMRMPGLPVVPASEGMDIDNDGVITGLS